VITFLFVASGLSIITWGVFFVLSICTPIPEDDKASIPFKNHADDEENVDLDESS